MKKLPITVGFCHPGQVTGAFNESMLSLFQRYELDGYISIHSGPRVARARNDIVRGFLNGTGSPYLLMVDTDMVFAPDAPERLLGEPALIIGGLYFGLHSNAPTDSQLFPQLYKRQPVRGGSIGRLRTWSEDEVIEVDATGAGFLLISRKVLLEMADYPDPHPWFEESVENGRELGEDVMFCLRAKEKGFRTYVHTGVRVGHVKQQII